MKHRDYLRLALREAEAASADDELPVGAVIELDGAVIARAHRRKTGDTRLDHAEMQALRAALPGHYADAGRMTLYTTLEPCAMCLGAILNARIGRVVYALEDPFGGATILLEATMPPRHQERIPEVIGGILREEVRTLFRTYFISTAHPFWSAHPDNPLVRIVSPIS